MSDEVMMAVSRPEALQHTEILVLRQISDALAQQSRSMETIMEHLLEVRDRVTRMEAQEVAKRIEVVETNAAAGRQAIASDIRAMVIRIDVLEAERDRRAGAFTVAGWITQHMPWLVALGAGAAAAVGWSKHG